MQQIGFKKAWKHILLKYLSPITNYHFIGYHMEAKHSLDFVVRYNPKKQSFLKPHHDASTVTLNLALNQGGVDYEGTQISFQLYVSHDDQVAELILFDKTVHIKMHHQDGVQSSPDVSLIITRDLKPRKALDISLFPL